MSFRAGLDGRKISSPLGFDPGPSSSTSSSSKIIIVFPIVKTRNLFIFKFLYRDYDTGQLSPSLPVLSDCHCNAT